MADEIDWSLTTFEGLRRKQQEEFAALPFSEKLARIEEMNEVAEMFETARAKRAADEAANAAGRVRGGADPLRLEDSAPPPSGRT
ncbi:hypothetical protein PHYC_00978 [Phycisphaerales bacterium]|nr:hypothetical protein PHYC_00978 [Phycisphaerales bacterium]